MAVGGHLWPSVSVGGHRWTSVRKIVWCELGFNLVFHNKTAGEVTFFVKSIVQTSD